MPREIQREEVRRLVAAGSQLVDVLPRAEYDAGHIVGAINLTVKELNRETAARLDPGRPVIVYCHDTQ
jgi:rhodanese-related sulfurtransferase